MLVKCELTDCKIESHVTKLKCNRFRWHARIVRWHLNVYICGHVAIVQLKANIFNDAIEIRQRTNLFVVSLDKV